MRILKHIKHGLRTKFKGLKVILSWWIENMLGVLLLFKISRNSVKGTPPPAIEVLNFSFFGFILDDKYQNNLF